MLDAMQHLKCRVFIKLWHFFEITKFLKILSKFDEFFDIFQKKRVESIFENFGISKEVVVMGNEVNIASEKVLALP